MSFARDITVGNCRLILGDMRDVLPLLDAKANMCMSDPPYPLTSGGNTNGELSGCFANEEYNNSGELFDMVDWAEMAPLIFDALVEDADAIIMSNDRQQGPARAAFEAVGFKFHRLLAWNKITATPNKYFMPNLEFGTYLWKGRARTINDCSSKALITCPQKDVSHLYIPEEFWVEGKRPRPHPTEKPVALMEGWISNCTSLGDTVLDPFMGGGSTVVAAVRSGRGAIGIEKDPKWFAVALARVIEAVNSPQSQLPLSAPVKAYQEALAL